MRRNLPPGPSFEAEELASVLDDPCDECEATDLRVVGTDYDGHYRLYTACVECRVCGWRGQRDLEV